MAGADAQGPELTTGPWSERKQKAVAALPIVAVTVELLAALGGADTQCAVCREELEVGAKVRGPPRQRHQPQGWSTEGGPESTKIWGVPLGKLPACWACAPQYEEPYQMFDTHSVFVCVCACVHV